MKLSKARVAQARAFAAQFDALDRHACTLQEWLMLKFSCTDDHATRLLRAMEQADDVALDTTKDTPRP